MRKIHISGPITGVKDFKEIFKEAEELLKGKGYEVVNPVTVGEHIENLDCPPEAKYPMFMRADLIAMLGCTHIYMLPGWTKSKGALIEYIVAKICGMRVLYKEGPKRRDFISWRVTLSYLANTLYREGVFDD